MRRWRRGQKISVGDHLRGLFDGQRAILLDDLHDHIHHELKAADAAGFFGFFFGALGFRGLHLLKMRVQVVGFGLVFRSGGGLTHALLGPPRRCVCVPALLHGTPHRICKLLPGGWIRGRANQKIHQPSRLHMGSGVTELPPNWPLRRKQVAPPVSVRKVRVWADWSSARISGRGWPKRLRRPQEMTAQAGFTADRNCGRVDVRLPL